MPSTYNNNIATIDAAINKVADTLDQELREVLVNPKEIKDEEISHPSTTTKTTRQVYNICKGKMEITGETTHIDLGIT